MLEEGKKEKNRKEGRRKEYSEHNPDSKNVGMFSKT